MATLTNYLARPDVNAEDFAARVGITRPSLSRIAAGKQNTTADVIHRIIAASGGEVTADGILFARHPTAQAAA